MGIKTKQDITREQLYELVWQEPASTLGPRLGLTDRGLAKVCERLGVPRPGRGYWAKKRAGHRMSRSKLPKRHDGPKVYRRTQPPKDSQPEESEPVRRQRAYEVKHPIRVPERSGRRPPQVRRTHQILCGQKGRTRATREALNVGVSKPLLSRALRIMSTLIRELDRRGFTVSVDDNRTYVDVNGTAVEVRLQEPYQKEYGPPSEWEVRWAELDGRDPKPSYELVPTEKLQLMILEYAEGLRKTFRDTKTVRLEDKLNDFMVALVAVAEAMKERKLMHAEWRRRREEEALRRAEERLREEREERRIEALGALARRWDEANRLRDYLAAVQEAMGAEPPSEATAWLTWAKGYLIRLEEDILTPFGDQPSGASPRVGGYRLS